MQLIMRHVLTILLLQVLFPILSYGQSSNAFPSFAADVQNPLWIDLSGSWQMTFEDRPEFAQPGYDDHAWQSITLPGELPASGQAFMSAGGCDAVSNFHQARIAPIWPSPSASSHSLVTRCGLTGSACHLRKASIQQTRAFRVRSPTHPALHHALSPFPPGRDSFRIPRHESRLATSRPGPLSADLPGQRTGGCRRARTRRAARSGRAHPDLHNRHLPDAGGSVPGAMEYRPGTNRTALVCAGSGGTHYLFGIRPRRPLSLCVVIARAPQLHWRIHCAPNSRRGRLLRPGHQAQTLASCC